MGSGGLIKLGLKFGSQMPAKAFLLKPGPYNGTKGKQWDLQEAEPSQRLVGH